MIRVQARVAPGRGWPALAGALAAGVLIAAAAAREAPAPVAFVDVSVIPMDTDRVVAHQTVLTRDGRVEWVGDAASAAIPPDATRVDGKGRFLLPGMADLHVHAEEVDLSLFLANGVTTVRQMNGGMRHLTWRDEVAAGTRVGPRLVVCTPLLTGTDDWPVYHSVITAPGQATQFVLAFAQHGFDCAKVYDGLAADVYAAIVKTARLSGLPVTGHIPESVGLDGVLAAGQWLEHTEKIVNAATGHNPDPAAMPAVADRIKAAGVTVTPTLAAQRVLATQGTGAFAARFDRPQMKYVTASTRAWWDGLRAGPTGHGGAAPSRERAARYYETQRALVKALAARGVPLVAGTDAPNALLVPGFSIHEELAALVEAGLSRFDALGAATAGAAEALGESGRFGVIRAGAAADIILVAADPLVDLAALERPVGVMAGGRWLDRARLDALLKDAAAAAARENK